MSRISWSAARPAAAAGGQIFRGEILSAPHAHSSDIHTQHCCSVLSMSLDEADDDSISLVSQSGTKHKTTRSTCAISKHLHIVMSNGTISLCLSTRSASDSYSGFFFFLVVFVLSLKFLL
jgi:hypothetical protein